MNKDIVERGDISFVDPRENSVYAEKKYVEVNEAIKTVQNASPTKVWDALQVLAEMEGADVAPVVHAHWGSLGFGDYECSNCHRQNAEDEMEDTSFCPFCGAKMDEEVIADE